MAPIPEVEQPQKQKGKPKSRKRKAEHDPEPCRFVKKRHRNLEKQALDKLSSLHMKCVRAVGSIKSVVSNCIANDFVPWFQKELMNIKIQQNNGLMAANVALRQYFETRMDDQVTA